MKEVIVIVKLTVKDNFNTDEILQTKWHFVHPDIEERKSEIIHFQDVPKCEENGCGCNCKNCK